MVYIMLYFSIILCLWNSEMIDNINLGESRMNEEKYFFFEQEEK